MSDPLQVEIPAFVFTTEKPLTDDVREIVQEVLKSATPHIRRAAQVQVLREMAARFESEWDADGVWDIATARLRDRADELEQGAP